ncbi:MAG: hypothetical protein AAGA57_07150 [Planctomycetota bacterium]
MRLALESMIAVAVAAGLGVALVQHRDQAQQAENERFVTESLARLQEVTTYQSALATAEAEPGVTPLVVAVDPVWFGSSLPTNVLLEQERPWLDLAPPGDTAGHPPDPVVLGEDQAMFWYNPTTGVYRARVPALVNERDTLALYNRVNGADLAVLPVEHDPLRQPLAYRPGVTPAQALASLEYRPRYATITHDTASAPNPNAPPPSAPDPAAVLDGIDVDALQATADAVRAKKAAEREEAPTPALLPGVRGVEQRQPEDADALAEEQDQGERRPTLMRPGS